MEFMDYERKNCQKASSSKPPSHMALHYRPCQSRSKRHKHNESLIRIVKDENGINVRGWLRKDGSIVCEGIDLGVFVWSYLFICLRSLFCVWLRRLACWQSNGTGCGITARLIYISQRKIVKDSNMLKHNDSSHHAEWRERPDGASHAGGLMNSEQYFKYYLRLNPTLLISWHPIICSLLVIVKEPQAVYRVILILFTSYLL